LRSHGKDKPDTGEERKGAQGERRESKKRHGAWRIGSVTAMLHQKKALILENDAEFE